MKLIFLPVGNLQRDATTSGIDPSETAAINSSAQILSADAGLMAASNLNNKTMNFDKQMYAQQRADALSDWNMQNAYNSPTAQMARLKAGGLNPNLIYGTGSDAGGISSTPRASSVQSWNPSIPQDQIAKIGDAVGSNITTQMQLAQLDNLKATNASIKQDTALKAAQTSSATASTGLTGVNTDQAAFNLSMDKMLQDITIHGKEVALAKQGADLDYTLDQNQRAWLQSNLDQRKGNYSILEAIQDLVQKKLTQKLTVAQTAQTNQSTATDYERMLNTGEERKKIIAATQDEQFQAKMAEMDARLKANGIQPGSAGWYQSLQIIMAELARGVKKAFTGTPPNSPDPLPNNP